MVISYLAEIVGFLRAALAVLPMSISCFRQLRLAFHEEIGRPSCKWCFFMICDDLINWRLWRVSELDKYLLDVQNLATYIFVDLVEERGFYMAGYICIVMFIGFENGQYQYYKTRKREDARRSNLTSCHLDMHLWHSKISVLFAEDGSSSWDKQISVAS
jgi:hypothetical protein